MDEQEPVEIPIDGELDLHSFQPGDVKDLVPYYLAACRERGILDVRIIHGKGTGALMRTVHSILLKLPEVTSFRLATDDASGWGATIVSLKSLSQNPSRSESGEAPERQGGGAEKPGGGH